MGCCGWVRPLSAMEASEIEFHSVTWLPEVVTTGSVVGLADVFASSYISPSATLGVHPTREHGNRQTNVGGTRDTEPLLCSQTVFEDIQMALRNGQTLRRRFESWNVYVRLTVSISSPVPPGTMSITWNRWLTLFRSCTRMIIHVGSRAAVTDSQRDSLSRKPCLS